MRRREFIALFGASVTWPFAATAQQAGRTYRLGCLFASGRVQELYDAFFEPARRHGSIEGQNLTVDLRNFSRHIDFAFLVGGRVKQTPRRCHCSRRGLGNSHRAERDENDTYPWNDR